MEGRIGRKILMLAILAGAAGCGHVTKAREATPEASYIDPDADAVMRRWSERAQSRKMFRFQAVDTIDEVLDTGQKIQLSHMRTATVSRPNQVRVDTDGDLASRTVWKNKKTFTVLDGSANEYMQIDAPGTIDETIDMLMKKYGISTPLGDLLASNPYEILMSQVETGHYEGIHHVDAIKCHHLSFTQPNIDWQIWIDAGDEPIARKLVITYKLEPGEPQYTVRLLDSEVLTEVPDSVFQPEIPSGAKKVDAPPAQKTTGR